MRFEEYGASLRENFFASIIRDDRSEVHLIIILNRVREQSWGLPDGHYLLLFLLLLELTRLTASTARSGGPFFLFEREKIDQTLTKFFHLITIKNNNEFS